MRPTISNSQIFGKFVWDYVCVWDYKNSLSIRLYKYTNKQKKVVPIQKIIFLAVKTEFGLQDSQNVSSFLMGMERSTNSTFIGKPKCVCFPIFFWNAENEYDHENCCASSTNYRVICPLNRLSAKSINFC